MPKNYVIKIDKDGNKIKDKKVPVMGKGELVHRELLKGVKVVPNDEYIEIMYHNGTIDKYFNKQDGTN